MDGLDGILSFSTREESIIVKTIDDDLVAERLIKALVESGARPMSIHEEKLDLEALT